MMMDDIRTSDSLKATALSWGIVLEDELCEFILAARDMVKEDYADVEIEAVEEQISLCTKMNRGVDFRISINHEEPDEVRLSAMMMSFTEKQAAIVAKKIVEGTFIYNYLGLEITLAVDKTAKGDRRLAMNYTAYICTGQVDQALGELGFIILLFTEEINQAIRAAEGIMTGGRYKVILQEIDDNRKIRVIKAVKDSAGMTLRQAKAVVWTRGVVAVESYEEAVRIRDCIRDAGATAEIIDTAEDVYSVD